jgi:hypothetical protein
VKKQKKKMNFQFDALATRLRESAAEAARQATEAARGMTNLEAMAEKDPYIHSGEDDDVDNNNNDYHHDDDNSTLSTHESAWLRQTTTTMPKNSASVPPGATATARQFPTVLSTGHSFETSAVKNTIGGTNSIPLKVSVPERQSSFLIGLSTSSRSNNAVGQGSGSFHDTYEADHTSDEEEDDEDDDPIFSLIRSERKHQETDPLSLHHETSHSDPDSQQQQKQTQNSSSDPATTELRKQHRFLTELDTRMAAEQKPLPILPSSRRQQNLPAAQSQQQSPWLALGSLTTAGNSSHSNTASKSNAQTTTVPAAPLSRIRQTYWNRSQDPPDNTEDWEHVALVSSSAMLGKEEMQALAALQSTPSPSICLSLITSHPKEAFIALTLLLAAYAYFHSRGYT